MTPRRLTAIRLDEESIDAMNEIFERDGILVAEQVRRAVQMWLKSKGVDVQKKSAPRRVSPRRKA